MKPVIFHPEARNETDEAAEYYAAVSDELRSDFLDEIERLASEVARNPQRSARYKKTKYRHLVARRFPYVLFYAELEDAIWIVAVAHAKRRPGYWSHRRIG